MYNEQDSKRILNVVNSFIQEHRIPLNDFNLFHVSILIALKQALIKNVPLALAIIPSLVPKQSEAYAGTLISDLKFLDLIQVIEVPRGAVVVLTSVGSVLVDEEYIPEEHAKDLEDYYNSQGIYFYKHRLPN